MKKQIKKIALLIIAILGVNCANAQNGLSVHVGLASPLGSFGEAQGVLGVMQDDMAWNDDESTIGGAGLGFNLGVKYKLFTLKKDLNLFASADLFYNTMCSEVKNFYNAIVEDKHNYYDEYYEILPKYINTPIMLGVDYEYSIINNIKVWGEAAMGVNLGFLTDHKYGFRTSSYMIGNSDQVDNYKMNTNLAFQIGGGVKVNDKYSLGIHYYSLGSRTIKSELEYENFFSGETHLGSRTETYGSINTGILTIRLGYHF